MKKLMTGKLSQEHHYLHCPHLIEAEEILKWPPHLITDPILQWKKHVMCNSITT